MKHLTSLALLLGTALWCPAQTISPDGGISPEMLQRLQQSYENTSSDRALRNAINNSPIDVLALNSENAGAVDTHFSHRVPSKGITNQKSSGRCWLFTGLNVLRAQMMAEHDLPELYLSQCYGFFYDQLEKANLFLQSIIDTSALPEDDRTVTFLFANPINDGGTFVGVADIISKYGVVPAEAMHETVSSENTAKMRQLIATKLREDGLRLRAMCADKKVTAEQVAQEKERMLGEVYRMLVLTLGNPPQEFTWTRRDGKGNVVDTRTYTPLSFYQEYAGNDLHGDYVMVMNDPLRPYYKLYEIEYDRHTYDGPNWTYVNLPMDDIRDLAIASIKDSTMMYFSCDVKKFYNKDRGTLDLNNYDYDALFGVNFGMDKRERIRTGASGSSHAMTLVGVDLDEKGKPRKWLIENSWGNLANNGHLIMTDDWFAEYMFRLVVNKKYAPKKVFKILEQEPTLLPAWDPMFATDD